jgi:sulfite reductase beta subunit-like hemoprotein
MEPTSAPERKRSDAAANVAGANGAGDADARQRISAEYELDVVHSKPQKAKGRRGSLENPEVYENVPGHVIPILEREFEDFDTEAGSFMRGEQTEEQFIGFRLKQGVYGQRQPDVQMIRTKLPMGGITPDQMDAFADAIEQWAPLNKGHITTRQNIQVHHVPLPDAAKFIRLISDAGLSSREGCGNTVRNVTGDPFAGVTEGELFDITPYAGAYVRYFVRHPTTQLMPRKIKTAFTATDEDVAITGIHDIGFIPRVRDGVRGVEMRVGGGTSIMPRIAPTLYEFVELDNGDFLKVSEAVFRLFDRQEWLRVNRARARIKVLIDKIGIDAFREMVEEELEGDWVAESDFSIEHLLLEADEEANAPGIPAEYSSPNGDSSAFDRFRSSNVAPQRQEGFQAVTVKVTRGDLTPEQMRGLAEIMREHTGGYARTTVQQNLVLRWVRDESVYDVWQRLLELGLGDPGAMEVTDVVSCPGTDSCKLGITSSMGLNAAIQERLETMDVQDEMTRRVNIKMSGCPNGCGQHHIGNIGFYGASIKVGEKTIPAYIAHIGGNFEGGEVIYGKRLKVRLPAKRVPDAVERWLRLYEAEREDGEGFNAFAERAGAERLENEVKELASPVEFGLETLDQFVDWNRSEPYQVERGEGECAV